MNKDETHRAGGSRRRLRYLGGVLTALCCFSWLNSPKALPAFWLPCSAVAGETPAEQPTGSEVTQPQSGATHGNTSASTEKTAKKSDQADVQSRGLFKKKKKKQKGGSASHMQAGEQIEVPPPSSKP